MRFFSFSMLIASGALLGHLYLYRRLVTQVTSSVVWRRVLGGFLAAATLVLLLRSPICDLGPEVKATYERVAYSWIALALSLVVVLACSDVLRLALAVARRVSRRRSEPDPNAARTAASTEVAPASPRPAPDADVDASRPRLDLAIQGRRGPSRRELLRAVPWGVVAGGGVMAGYGAYRAFTPPEVTEVVIPLAKLPRALDGLTIAQLTDVHVGSFIGERFIDMLVSATNAHKPDVVAITGDLVDGPVEHLGPAVAALAKLRSRFGTYFVTGNHEFYAGELEWVAFLDRLGITVLRNGRVPIGDAGGAIDLVGVDDWTGARRSGGRGYDLARALGGRDPDRGAVLLAHQPENFEVAAQEGVDLQISGHTHGGQLFPMTELVGLRYPFHRGLYRHGESRLYVSRGCGFWGPPSRVGSPPEIVKYVLTHA